MEVENSKIKELIEKWKKLPNHDLVQLQKIIKSMSQNEILIFLLMVYALDHPDILQLGNELEGDNYGN